MRRRTALAVLAAGVCLGTAAGLGVRAATNTAAYPHPTRSSATVRSPAPSALPSAPPATASRRPSSPIDRLLTPADLAAAGWPTPAPRVTTDSGFQAVSPCQGDSTPFDGLPIAAGRWSSGGPTRRGGEIVADTGTPTDAEARALLLYNRHLACAGPDTKIGERHSVVVDGGSIAWFPVTDRGVAGYSCVIRIVDRFALLYVDRSAVTVHQLPNLLRSAADRLR